ncbi:MAG: D-alanyl-D-alanine carboxypeptidase, partial [Lachnospiraceae bacterium]|nr:D-alanyl-D-alanine carboxypeptidase [Lachnospiraceae bacterium]
TEVRSALVGDATTGEIYAGFSENVPVSVASTTKLMNLLCVMDAVSSGEISLSDRTYASLKASLLSMTGDGVIPMEPGDGFTVEELIYGMMLPSSNECSLMLAEHIAGTEDEYVKRMNDKAVEIGLSDATIFYNCHGLPIYSDNIVTSKLQNQMSASDMFSLVSYLLAVYPQVTDITSTREYRIESAGLTVKNLNPMLYNLPEAVGMKTGTTYMAGYSLVSAVRVKDAAGTEHIVTAVEYGAEDVVTRNTVSELMLRFGMDRLSGKNEGDLSDGSLRTLPDGTNIPVTAEGLIRLLLSS